MDKPLVSVIVLTLNSDRYARRCFRSLERQTYPNFEVLIVDAGSTDSTRAIAASFDARFKWLELPRSDMGAARNHGIAASRGEIICFLDSDDFYLPQKIEHQVNELQYNPLVDVVYCSAWHFRSGTISRLGLKKLSDQPRVLQDYLEGRNHNLNTMCMRRSVWEAGFAFGEGDRGRYGEEWRLQLSMAQGGVTMAFRPDPQVVVEIRPDSHTAWSLQWTMKHQAIKEIQRVAALLTPAQRTTMNVTGILNDFRCKLVVALLLDGRKKEALIEVSAIDDLFKARRARLLATCCRYLPKTVLRQMLQRVWLWRQNRSFDWHAISPTMKTDFASVHADDGR